MKRTAAMVALTLSLVPFASFAQSAATPRVDQRQANQDARIQKGVKSGELTRNEAARLEKGQDRIEKIEDKAKSDGKVTPRERARLDKAQDKQSVRIKKEKHDHQADRNHDGKLDHPDRKHAKVK